MALRYTGIVTKQGKRPHYEIVVELTLSKENDYFIGGARLTETDRKGLLAHMIERGHLSREHALNLISVAKTIQMWGVESFMKASERKAA